MTNAEMMKANKRLMNQDISVSYTAKYVRYKNGAKLYDMGMTKFQQVAKDAGAVIKIGGTALVDVAALDNYLESFRL